MKAMEATNYFLFGSEPATQEGIHTRCCNPGQKPMAWGVTDPEGEPTTIVTECTWYQTAL